MIGLQAIVFVLFAGASFGLSYVPTEPNIKNVVRLSLEGEALESITDKSNWKYVKKEKDYDVVEFTGYDYEEKKNVKIKFAVYLNDDYFEWQEVYVNNKKLSEEEVEEYQIYIEENNKLRVRLLVKNKNAQRRFFLFVEEQIEKRHTN